MNNVIYIAEKKEFIVNGKTIKESDITPQEAENLKSKANKQTFIIDEHTDNGTPLI